MRSTVAVLLVALTVGCGGHDTGDGVQPDAGPLPACTGVAYDSCADVTNNSDCTDGTTCHLFMGDGFTICTPTCDASHPCPDDKDGNTVACNMKGLCKASPNACTP